LQPITAGEVRPAFTPQTAYIHPRVTGDKIRYFEWMGAAVFTADQRAGAMHGKQYLLDAVHAGIDSTYVYGRLDFSGSVPESEFNVVVNLESWANADARPRRSLRLDARVEERKLVEWKVEEGDSTALSTIAGDGARVALLRNFEFRLPLSWLLATPGSTANSAGSETVMIPSASKLRLRFSLWQNRLPVDALPVGGWIDLDLVSEEELAPGM
jgi:hypothetical protein